MTRQILVALWQFAGQVPKGSKNYEQIKEILIEELKAGIKTDKTANKEEIKENVRAVL